jgi:hypothetical protein
MQALTRGRDERPRRLDLTPVNDNAGLGALIAEPAADARCSAHLFAAEAGDHAER